MIYAQTSRYMLHQGDALSVLREMPANSVHCCATSPPYWGLRAYGTEPQVWDGAEGCEHEWQAQERAGLTGGTNQGGKSDNPNGATYRPVPPSQSAFCALCGAWRGELGLEPSFDLYVSHIVQIFEEVRRVLHPSGVLWLQHGDSWACAPNGRSAADTKAAGRDDRTFRDKPDVRSSFRRDRAECSAPRRIGGGQGLKPKDLVGQAWALAFALRDAGWYLRDSIIWYKRSAMPSSVTDRTTMAHEYIFLLTKQPRYFFDSFAIRERCTPASVERMARGWNGNNQRDSTQSPQTLGMGPGYGSGEWRNKRSVWDVLPEASKESHYATYPTALIKPMVLAGTSAKGVCGRCGAPWERIVRKSRGGSWHPYGDDLEHGQSDVWRAGPNDGQYRVESVGWRPTCGKKCKQGDGGEIGPVEPATVLDPFAGTATTGLIAIELGRKAILIELSPKYCKMAEKRLRGGRVPLPGMEDCAEEDDTGWREGPLGASVPLFEG